MLKRLYLTKKQWRGVLKWSLYSLLFLFLLINESVIFAHFPVHGAKLNLIPAMLLCVCLQEGMNNGGIFCLCANIFCCLASGDYSCVSVAVLTVLPMLAACFCKAYLTKPFFPGWLMALVISLFNEALILVLRFLLARTAIENLWLVVIPGCVLAALSYPLFYLLARLIGRTGVSDGT